MSSYIKDNEKKLVYSPKTLLTQEHYDSVVLGGIYTASPFTAQGLDYETAMMGEAYYSPYDERCWVFQAMQEPETGYIWLVDTFHSHLENMQGKKTVVFAEKAFEWKWRLDESVWDMFSLRMADIGDWEEADSYEYYSAEDIVHGVCFGPGNHSMSCDDWKRKDASPSLLMQISALQRELSDCLSSTIAKARWLGSKAAELQKLVEQAEQRGIDFSGKQEELDMATMLADIPRPFALSTFADMDDYLSTRCIRPGEIFEENGFVSHSFTGRETAWKAGEEQLFAADEGNLGTVQYQVVHLAIPEREALIRVFLQKEQVADTVFHDLTAENLSSCLKGTPILQMELKPFGIEHSNKDVSHQIILAEKLSQAIENLVKDEEKEN